MSCWIDIHTTMYDWGLTKVQYAVDSTGEVRVLGKVLPASSEYNTYTIYSTKEKTVHVWEKKWAGIEKVVRSKALPTTVSEIVRDVVDDIRFETEKLNIAVQADNVCRMYSRV